MKGESAEEGDESEAHGHRQSEEERVGYHQWGMIYGWRGESKRIAVGEKG